MASRVATPIATWFGCGYVPKAPGTVGSVAAIVIAFLLVRYVGFVPLTFFWLAALMLKHRRTRPRKQRPADRCG
jgi:phosphatidylglycerophosphatase A